jgi:AcrR family transcriptional regulator
MAPTKQRTTRQVSQNGQAAHMRDQVLEASLRLFFEQGFRGTSVREITLACGVTPGALYNHFPSKEDVLETLIRRTTTEGHEYIQSEVARAPQDPVSRLHAAVRSSTLYNTRHRAASLVATFEYIHLPEEARARVVAKRRELRVWLEQIIQEGLDAGVLTLPKSGGRNKVKLVATAIANLALRASDFFGPTPTLSEERIADFHAELTLNMLQARLPE